MTEASSCLICSAPVSSAAEGLECVGCGFKGRLDGDGIAHARFEQGEVGYPQDGNENTMDIEDDSFWFRHRNQAILSLIRRFAVSGVLVDVGGGNGLQAAFLQSAGVPTVVVEPGNAGCRNARKRGVERVVNATLESLRLKDACIPAASFFDVLEHLDHPREVLRETSRVLKPGGRVLITVPAFQSLWSHEDEYAQHRRRYTRGSLERELRESGFAVEFISYYFQVLMLPILVLRALPYRLGLMKGAIMSKSDHRPGKAASGILGRLLEREISRLTQGRAAGFGSSVICVARKVAS